MARERRWNIDGGRGRQHASAMRGQVIGQKSIAGK
jgi:hypothetical protein